MKSLTVTIFAIGLAAAPVWAQNKKNDPNQIGNRDVSKGINLYTIEKEIALGKQLAQEVTRQSKLIDDPVVSELVNRIGQNLVRNSDAQFPFTFQVIQDDSLNAFTLPGGYVFVNSGLIKIVDEEDEFAAAVAHEIAHGAARHMTRQKSKSEIANIGTIPLSVILGGWGGVAARQAAGSIIPMTFLSFSRKDEAEADFLGVQYMWAAGYDPAAAISVFEKMESMRRTRPGTFSKLFSTHPMDADRIAKTQKEIDTILPAKQEYVVNTSEYKQMRERLIMLENKRTPDDPTKPQLRRAPEVTGPDTNTDSDGRPTIKRRDLVD